MPQQLLTAVENNFTKGLITENTGLNFPENATTDTDNCEYTLIGEVLRRLGVNREPNGINNSINRTGLAINSYKWNNAGGDGNSQLLVVQVGGTLHFYDIVAATTASPISANKLASTVSLSSFSTGTFDTTVACEFSDGNGYLFVYQGSMNPIYCTYSGGAVTGNSITVQTRDFVGVPEIGVDGNIRPSSLTDSHKYNLQNQGWISQNPWTATDTTTSHTLVTGIQTFTVASGIPGIVATQYVLMQPYFSEENSPFTSGWMYGLVTAYAGTNLTINVTGVNNPGPTLGPPDYYWKIIPVSSGYITTWNTALGNYPSNADQWWRFKTTSNVFDPATVVNNISVGLGAAPKGHYILDAFDQRRYSVSGITTVTDITTLARPTNGCWFQGRVWYTGVNTSQAATGTAPFYTWSENIYFSQVVNKTDDFGRCYQVNDPTTQELFDLLPTDGGVIVIQGSGPIYKLFPIQNGLLVFAGNGVWFITGSQGIGFTANDYTVTKISSVQSISSTSFVDVLGLPYFWNEEGIYKVTVAQNGSLSVEAITHTTIETFYKDIPVACKKLVRGAYNPIEWVIQWVYRSTDYTSTDESYTFDRALNYSTANQAFYPYTFDTSSAAISSITYVAGPGGLTTLNPAFKYFVTSGSNATIADLNDTTYVDWEYTGTGVNYSSYLVTGYKIRGQAIKKSQPQYIQVWNNQTNDGVFYKFQGLWDYAISGDSGRWSSVQQANILGDTNFSVVSKRHKIRGRGFALQFKMSSQDGLPFDFIGWAAIDTVNQGA